jgi:RNA-splicing ligase RtcB
MSRSASHQWVGIIPGDMHTKGYLGEAFFKEQGCGGFHHLVQKVMKRPKLTKEAFKKKKICRRELGQDKRGCARWV